MEEVRTTINNKELVADLLALAIMCANEETDNCDIILTTSRGKINCHIEFSDVEIEQLLSYNSIKTELETCGDCVNRQAVLDYIYNDLGLGDEENGKDVERQMELESSYRYIKSLPSVKPQESKTAQWIVNEWGNIYCSGCGCAALYDKVYPGESVFGKAIRVKTTFCPTCGAKMVDPQESEVQE